MVEKRRVILLSFCFYSKVGARLSDVNSDWWCFVLTTKLQGKSSGTRGHHSFKHTFLLYLLFWRAKACGVFGGGTNDMLSLEYL